MFFLKMTTSETSDSKQDSNLMKPEKVNIEKPTEVLGDLVQEALSVPSNAQLPINKESLNPDIIKKAVTEIAIKYKTTPGKAYAGICCTLQAGGTTGW